MFTLEALYARRTEFNLGRQEEKARFLAHHDPLTSLANRTLLSQELEAALAKARARPFPIYLLALDLDGFKAVNDTFGHHVGDELLKVVAGRLTRVVKTTDLVARLRVMNSRWS